MFTKILQFIKEIWAKMIGQSSVKQALKVDIAISSAMAEALQKWAAMYENKAPWLTDDIRSLNLPAAIAGEIARAVTIEMQVEISGSARADFLARQFAPVLAKMREKVEVGAAKGGLMMKPYVDGKNLAVDFVQADQFYPVAFDSSGNIPSCIFVDQRQVGDKFYTRLEHHAMTEQGCEIRNMAYKSDTRDALGQQVPLTDVDAWAELLPEATITGITRPLYAYFRYPLANNIDPTSPLGVSCYSRAADLIEQADRIYSNLLWEFKSGKRKMVVDRQAIGKDKDGNPIYPTDEDRNLFMALDAMGENVIGEGGKLFEAWSPEFREASILAGLDALLKKIETACGLAFGTISDPNEEAKTATEIKTTKQRTYATVTDAQKALQTALDQLVYAMDVWATLGSLATRGAYQTAYQFDDSVVTDTELQFSQDKQISDSGYAPKWWFLVRNYGMTEAEAKALVKEAQSEMQADTDFFQDQGGR